MDWKQKYVRKLTNYQFELNSVQLLVSQIIDELNPMLEVKSIDTVKHYDQCIFFPDCRITYSIRDNILSFDKHPKDNSSTILSTVNVNVVEGYFMKNHSKKKYEELSKEFIEDIIQYLLFTRK